MIKDKLNFQKSPLPVDTSFENRIFMTTPLIREETKKLKTHMGVPSITGLVDSCASQSKPTRILNTLPFVSVDILMLQQNLPSLP